MIVTRGLGRAAVVGAIVAAGLGIDLLAGQPPASVEAGVVVRVELELRALSVAAERRMLETRSELRAIAVPATERVAVRADQASALVPPESRSVMVAAETRAMAVPEDRARSGVEMPAAVHVAVESRAVAVTAERRVLTTAREAS